MYQQNDLTLITRQIRRRLYILLIPCALLLAGIVVSVLPGIRLEWLTIVLTITLGAVLIFCDGLFIAPLRAYRRHLDSALHGRTRQLEGIFKSVETVSCLKDGVTFYPMIVSAGDPDDEEDDRLFYFDAEKAFPPLKAGDRISLTYHDKAVVALTLA